MLVNQQEAQAQPTEGTNHKR